MGVAVCPPAYPPDWLPRSPCAAPCTHSLCFFLLHSIWMFPTYVLAHTLFTRVTPVGFTHLCATCAHKCWCTPSLAPAAGAHPAHTHFCRSLAHGTCFVLVHTLSPAAVLHMGHAQSQCTLTHSCCCLTPGARSHPVHTHFFCCFTPGAHPGRGHAHFCCHFTPCTWSMLIPGAHWLWLPSHP